METGNHQLDTADFKRMAQEYGLALHRSEDVVYKYCSAKTAQEILRCSQFRYASPTTFNDPFEMHIDLLNMSVRFSDFRKIMTDADPRLSKKEVRMLMNRMSHNEIVEFFRKYMNKRREQTPILCLSKTYQNTLMWSHYADHHRGVCLGVTVPSFDKTLMLCALNVVYVDKIHAPRFSLYNDQETVIASLYWTATKSRVWEYEQEVRSVFVGLEHREEMEGKYLLIPFEQSIVKEIHYGLCTPEDDIHAIEKIIHKKDYPIQKRSKMAISPGTYDLISKPM